MALRQSWSIYVRNFRDNTIHDTLFRCFMDCGRIVSITIIPRHYDRVKKREVPPYAFVEFSNHSSYQRALNARIKLIDGDNDSDDDGIPDGFSDDSFSSDDTFSSDDDDYLSDPEDFKDSPSYEYILYIAPAGKNYTSTHTQTGFKGNTKFYGSRRKR